MGFEVIPVCSLWSAWRRQGMLYLCVKMRVQELVELCYMMILIDTFHIFSFFTSAFSYLQYGTVYGSHPSPLRCSVVDNLRLEPAHIPFLLVFYFMRRVLHQNIWQIGKYLVCIITMNCKIKVWHHPLAYFYIHFTVKNQIQSQTSWFHSLPIKPHTLNQSETTSYLLLSYLLLSSVTSLHHWCHVIYPVIDITTWKNKW